MHTIEVLRGEGNLSFEYDGLFQDARKIARWIQKGSNYAVRVDRVPVPAVDERLRLATDEELRTALTAYKEGVLEEGPKKYRVFQEDDIFNVSMGLALRGLETEPHIVMEAAEQMGLT